MKMILNVLLINMMQQQQQQVVAMIQSQQEGQRQMFEALTECLTELKKRTCGTAGEEKPRELGRPG